MLQFPISFDEVAKGLHDVVGVIADKRVETQVQIADVPAKFDVLYQLPHFYTDFKLKILTYG